LQQGHSEQALDRDQSLIITGVDAHTDARMQWSRFNHSTSVECLFSMYPCPELNKARQATLHFPADHDGRAHDVVAQVEIQS
jgi:hypothetical protein